MGGDILDAEAIDVIEGPGESHCSEITALFGAEHFSKLSAERRDGAVLCTGTVTTAEDVTEAELADILAANEFIRSIERCDDE